MLVKLRTRVLGVALGLGVLFSAVLVPHAVRPRAVPLPLVDHARLRALDEKELSRFEWLGQSWLGQSPPGQPPSTGKELSLAVRTAGELLRRAGAKVAARDPGARATLADLQETVQKLRLSGHTDELLSLRSLQSQLFSRAVRATPSAARDVELRELGGEFAELLARGWLSPKGGWWPGETADQLVLSDAELRLLFRVRWGLLTGCHRQAPFGPTLEELRAYHSLYLQFPIATEESAVALERARQAEALGRIDPSYPVRLALGVFLLEAGESDAARAQLEGYMAERPNGPLTFLARNYALEANAKP